MASSIPAHLAPSSSTAPPNQGSPRAPRSRPSPQPSPQHSSPRSVSPRNVHSGALDVDHLLRSHGGDVRKALDAVVADRNQLQSQNSQLWKLIERQRSQCAHLNNDNERLRADRERANGKLAAAGMETVGHVKKLPNSSSAMGLGIQADPPAVSVARRNSERDQVKEEAIQLQTPSTEPIPQTARQAPQLATELSPSTNSSPQVALLPSAMPSKVRHDDRMVFPSEVNTFMTLAESPKDATHPVTAIAASTSNNTLSPSSQYSSYSPSPKQTGKEDVYDVSVPPSSRQLAVMTEEDEDDGPANIAPPRASSLKSPSTATTSTHSPFPPTAQAPPSQQRRRDDEPARASIETTRRADPPRPSIDTETYPFHQELSPKSAQEPYLRPSLDNHAVALGDQPTPGMTPQLLPHSRITVPDTTIYPNSLGRDVLCFIINVSIRPPNAPPMSWNVAKLLSAFIDLDSSLKHTSRKSTKEWKAMVAPLPDGKAWKDFAPSKIDQRKTALEAYMKSLQVAPLSDKSYLCEFLSSDIVQPKAPSQRREGYLTKRGKRWGGWTTRYFVLDGPVLEYFDTRGGRPSGSIVITNAQIGRQNNKPSDLDDGEFRHAFLIIEQKKGVALRHVLCAPSDLDRERWIESLVQQVDPKPAPSTTPAASSSSTVPQQAPSPKVETSPVTPSTSSGPIGLQRKRSASRKSSKDVIVTNAQPMASMPTTGKFANAPSPGMINSLEAQKSHSQSSQQSNSNSSGSAPISQSSTVMSVSETSQSMMTDRSNGRSSASHDSFNDPTPRPGKRQSSVPPRQYTPAYLTKLSTDGMNAPPGSTSDHKDRDRKAKSGRFWPSFGKTPEKVTRPVFGVPLNESLAVASVASLPAVVFRCIEWLETNKAQDEEGIYRLSGSSAVIKGLKERFDHESDVNLTKLDDRWDPHAIAGLLKTFLRDLPTGILTRDLHPKFLAVMDMIDSSARVAELSRLVSELPPPNYALLRSLTAHLILIVKHFSTNKMTLRNIGIIFSPTLGIPAGIFSDLVTHFGAIFDAEEEVPGVAEPVQETTADLVHERSGLRPSMDNADGTVKRNRNSVLYQAAGADAMLGIGGRSLDPNTVDDSASEVSEMEDYDSETHSQAHSHPRSAHSSEDHSSPSSPTTPRADRYPSASAVRRAKAAARGLRLEPNRVDHGNGGLPLSPRPIAVINEGIAR